MREPVRLAPHAHRAPSAVARPPWPVRSGSSAAPVCLQRSLQRLGFLAPYSKTGDRKRAFQLAVNAYARVAIDAVKLFHSNVELVVLYALLNAPHEVDICGNFFLGLHDDQDLASRVFLEVTTVRRALRALAAGGFAKPFESQRRFVQEGRAVAANLTPRADISYLWGVDFVAMVDSILLRMNEVETHFETQKKNADDSVYVCRQCGSRQSASFLLQSVDACLLLHGDLKCTGTSPLCRDEALELETLALIRKKLTIASAWHSTLRR